ncbi:MAG: hypothetical protein WC728_02555 [Elusimicrobiota bacterium]
MHRRLLLLLLFPISFAACAHSRLKLGVDSEGEVVDAEGLVPCIETDMPMTKANALAAAQRSAVERVAGVFIAADTRVKKAMAIDQNILAKTAGYVKKYDILEEARDGQYYRTRIRALVSFERLQADLRSIGLLDVLEAGSPRVGVRLRESVDGSGSDTLSAADGLTAALLEAGYTVVDRAASEKDAEVLMDGEGSAARLDPHPKFTGFVSYRARVSAKAVRSGTAQVLASAEADASGMDVSAPAAAAKALRNAGRLAGNELRTKVAEALKTRSEVVLQVRGLGGVDELTSLQKALDAIPTVDGVHLRFYGGGEAVLSLRAGSASGQELSEKLSGLKGPALRVLEASPSRIVAEVPR